MGGGRDPQTAWVEAGDGSRDPRRTELEAVEGGRDRDPRVPWQEADTDGGSLVRAEHGQTATR